MKAKIFVTAMAGLASLSYIHANATKDTINIDDIHRYMWAEYQRFGGNGKEAYLWYKDLFSLDPSPHAYQGYIHFLSQTGNTQSIIKLYDQHKDTFKKDDAIQLIFAQSLEAADRKTEALELLDSLVTTFKKNPKITLYASQTYIQKKDFKKALMAIDSYLNSAPKTPNNYLFYFLKSQIYTQQNDLHKALKYTKKCLKAYPDFDKGWLMYAALKEQTGHLQEAIKGYSTFLRKTNQPNFDIQKYLMNLVFKQKMLEQQTNSLLTDKTDLEKALLFFKNKQYESALEKVDSCIASEPQNIEAKMLKVQILTSMHNYTKAADALQIFALNDSENDIWYQALHLLCRSGLPYKKAIKVLHTIEKKHPTTLHIQLYLADLLTRDNQFDRAIEHHIKALAQTTDPILQTRLQYNMAIIHYQLQKFTSMLTALNEIQKLNDEFIPALNLHAYYLATKGKSLNKAKKIIAKVLKKESTNPHYVDTYAVILYKEKKYQKAYDLLQKLAKAAPDDTTIIKHLAKAQFKLGKKEQALSMLDRAIKYANAYEKKECESLLKRWKS